MEPKDVKTALVVGAGVMGHAIAQVFAQAGMDVNLVDVDDKRLERAVNLIKWNLETLALCNRVPPENQGAILDLIHPSTELPSAAASVDFALEAVPEVPDIKKKIFSQLDKCCSEDTILASNTSSLDIFTIASIGKPERLICTHWFAPPHIVPLVEIVPGPKTSQEVITSTIGLMNRLGKKTVEMKTFVPSFIVNRIQNGIARTVWEMLEKGWATPEQIDLAVKLSLGIRLPVVGVVQTSDFAGLDLIFDIMKAQGSVHPIVDEKIKHGHLGVKTSKGIYDYGARSEEEILRKRDERYIKVLDCLERINAFEPV